MKTAQRKEKRGRKPSLELLVFAALLRLFAGLFVLVHVGFAVNGKGEEALLVAAAHLQEYVLPAFLARIPDGVRHVVGSGHGLAVNLDDDVAALQTLIGSFRIRIDAGNRDAFLRFASGKLRGRHQRQAQIFKLFSAFILFVTTAAAEGCDLIVGREFAELDGDVALFAIAEDMQPGIRAGRQSGDRPCEFTRVA